jgi:paraquat-inducible protein B
VQVGTVKDITVLNDSATGEVKIRVIAEFHPEAVTNIYRQGKTREENIKNLVEQFGLRAQLRTQSFITGRIFIEVDYHPGTELKYRGNGTMVEIPTIPSRMEQLGKQLQEFDIQSVAGAVSSAAMAIAQLASSPELKLAITNLNHTLESTNKLATDIDMQIDPMAKSVNKALKDLDKTLVTAHGFVENADSKLNPLEKDLRSTLATLEKTLAEIKQSATNVKQFSNENSPTIYKLNTALDELAKASRSVRTLADTLESHPEAIIRGKKR